MLTKPHPQIKNLTEKKLIGKRMRMSLAQNKTAALWRSFITEYTSIPNRLTNVMISMQVYDKRLRLGDLNQEFEKWAAVEVSAFTAVPCTMETFILKSGLYAVFHYKGLDTENRIFKYIFTDWLPKSGYLIDYRPHFEILGNKYKNGDPNSEEEIWIPIQEKTGV